MKKTVFKFGLISGVILAGTMLISLPFHDALGINRSLILGYTSMVLAFLLVFFGVRSYRDNVAGGTVRFGRAFAVGTLIVLVASLCYVVAWEVAYYNFVPDYMTKYQTRVLEKARAEGASEEAIAKQRADLEKFAVMYKNPAINALFTLAEPLPVGLIFALVSAGVLCRRKKSPAGG